MKMFLLYTYDEQGSEDYYIIYAEDIRHAKLYSEELIKIEEGWSGEITDLAQKFKKEDTTILHIAGIYV